LDAAPLHRPQNLKPVDARHLEIEDDAVDGVTPQSFECFVARTRSQGFISSQPLQVVGVLLGHRHHIVHD